jgi:hypothetical protein
MLENEQDIGRWPPYRDGDDKVVALSLSLWFSLSLSLSRPLTIVSLPNAAGVVGKAAGHFLYLSFMECSRKHTEEQDRG